MAKRLSKLQRVYDLASLDFLKEKNYHIGLLGGSFNPAHIGHLHITNQALEKLSLDYVIWLVALQNSFKPNYQLNIFTRAQNALDLAQDPRIIVSTLEYDLKQNITYNVLKFLSENFGSTQFTWIMGSDNLQHFELWDNFWEIPKFCNIAIFNRPGSLVNKKDLQKFKAKFTRYIDKKQTSNIMLCRGPMVDISSTKIRHGAYRMTEYHDTEQLKNFIIGCLEEKKAENISTINLENKTSLAKIMIFASGRSTKNVSAIADYVAHELKHKTDFKVHIEGLGTSEWVLIDVGDIIVHVFHPEARNHYKVEEKWTEKDT